jgi:hypothetical protein
LKLINNKWPNRYLSCCFAREVLKFVVVFIQNKVSILKSDKIQFYLLVIEPVLQWNVPKKIKNVLLFLLVIFKEMDILFVIYLNIRKIFNYVNNQEIDFDIIIFDIKFIIFKKFG